MENVCAYTLHEGTKLKPRWDAHMAEVKWRQQAVL